MKYITIQCSSDGDFFYKRFNSKEEMFEYFEDEKVTFLEEFPRYQEDFYIGESSVLVIEGVHKVPKPVEIVKKYDL